MAKTIGNLQTIMIRIGRSLILVLLLASTMVAAVEEEAVASRAQLTLDDLRTFTDVFNQVRNNFVEETDDHTLLNAAIRGMLSELDPHSSYMEADKFRQMDDSSRGRYSGIGVELLIKDKRIKVVSVMEDGAANKAGVVSGDFITSIGQTDVRGRDLQSAIDSLRGEAGTEIEVTIEHINGEVSQHKLVRGFVNVVVMW